jgi:hypothetical protein
MIMDELSEMLRPAWGSEKWILEGWNVLSSEEKLLIRQRMDALFAQGLPFELQHDKLLYIYAFSLLAQLEVLAIQIPLKFGPQMTSPLLKERMRAQLIDEIFHGLVFTKILYLLCAPLAVPPAYNENVEVLCNFLRNETCPKTALMLLNLISEGWIEEVFYSLERQGIAPRVFAVIVEDEHRHVKEAEIYQVIGMPDLELIQKKLAFLEEELLTNIFAQYKYMMSFCTLLGSQGTAEFIQALNIKHKKQLRKINQVPTPQWEFFMRFCQDILAKLQSYAENMSETIPMTPMRKILMTQWDDPRDPTMMAQFEIDISCLDIFNKNKNFPPETLTCLVLQALSKGLLENTSFRSYLADYSLYYSKSAFVGLVVKLPRCNDHLGTIVLENCHTMPLNALFKHLRKIVKKMVYCYKKRSELEQLYPYLAVETDKVMYEWRHDGYDYPLTGTPFVSLSNLQSYGFRQCLSPLRSKETMKFTLLDAEKKMVWDKNSEAFIIKDMLPISLSADHRIIDGNFKAVEIMQRNFNEMFDNFNNGSSHLLPKVTSEINLKKLVDYLSTKQVKALYKVLYFLQTYWFDALSIEKLLNSHHLKLAYFSEEFL